MAYDTCKPDSFYLLVSLSKIISSLLNSSQNYSPWPTSASGFPSEGVVTEMISSPPLVSRPPCCTGTEGFLAKDSLSQGTSTSWVQVAEL